MAYDQYDDLICDKCGKEICLGYEIYGFGHARVYCSQSCREEDRADYIKEAYESEENNHVGENVCANEKCRKPQGGKLGHPIWIHGNEFWVCSKRCRGFLIAQEFTKNRASGEALGKQA